MNSKKLLLLLTNSFDIFGYQIKDAYSSLERTKAKYRALRERRHS